MPTEGIPMSWFTALYMFFHNLHPFLTGAAAALNFVGALLFLRFYRKSSERLFLFFAAAFFIMALNRLAFVIYSPGNAEPVPLYFIRLTAFLLILFAILDKNRAPRAPR